MIPGLGHTHLATITVLPFILYFSTFYPSTRAEIEGNARLSGFGDKFDQQPRQTSYFEEKGPSDGLSRGQHSNFGGGNSGGGSQLTWGYGPDDGPDKWGGICRAGIRNDFHDAFISVTGNEIIIFAGQSPVDIRASQVDVVAMDQLRFFNYEKKGAVAVKNTGRGGWCFLSRKKISNDEGQAFS